MLSTITLTRGGFVVRVSLSLSLPPSLSLSIDDGAGQDQSWTARRCSNVPLSAMRVRRFRSVPFRSAAKRKTRKKASTASAIHHHTRDTGLQAK
uniref:Putative secreted peptide n=1 Tax=Anopheles braziliensis TaxID=58242 RepID=A0A2M3ZML1_9DIPT